MSIPITKRVKRSIEGITHDYADTPILKKNLEEGVKGEANKDGSIYIDDSIDPNSKEGKSIIAHEKVHLDQMERGDLDYDEKNIYWTGRIIPISKINEGSKHLPWEKEAYEKTKNA